MGDGAGILQPVARSAAFKMVIPGGVSGVLIAFGAAATRMGNRSSDFEPWICLPFSRSQPLSFFPLRKIRNRQGRVRTIGIDIMAAGIIVCMWSAKEDIYCP